jgi:hypothetical protein
MIIVNDGVDNRYSQRSPKKRALALLYDIKAYSALKEAQEIVNISKEAVLVNSGYM